MRIRNCIQAAAIGLALAGLGAAPAAAQVVVVAEAGEVPPLECSATDGTPVTLDGTASTVDGVMASIDPNTTFLWEAPGIVFDDETGVTPNADFPLGTTVVTLTVTHTDPTTFVETSHQDTVDVAIGDTTPPTLTVLSDPMVLWPPNHKLWEVELDLMVMDNCDPDPLVTLTSIQSNEPDNSTGDGNTVDDIQEADLGTDDRLFLLRAERKGNGSGRTYAATYNVVDASGNTSNGQVLVMVPHDKGDLKAAKASAKAAKKAAKAAEKAAKQSSKDAAKLAKQAAKAAKKAAKAAAKAARKGS
jgi:hypothetical protein